MAVAASRVLLSPRTSWTRYNLQSPSPASPRPATSPYRTMHQCTPLTIDPHTGPWPLSQARRVAIGRSQRASVVFGRQGGRAKTPVALRSREIRKSANTTGTGTMRLLRSARRKPIVPVASNYAPSSPRSSEADWEEADLDPDELGLGEHFSGSSSLYKFRSLTRKAPGIVYACSLLENDMAKVLRSSIGKLNILINRGFHDMSRPSPPIIAARMDILDKLYQHRDRGHMVTELMALGHMARRLVMFTTVYKSILDSTTYALLLKKFIFDFKATSVRDLAKQLSADAQDLKKGAGAHDLERELKRHLSSHYNVTKAVRAEIGKASELMVMFAQLEDNTYGLSHLHLHLFMNRFYRIVKPLQWVQRWSLYHRPRLFPLSVRYTSSLENSLAGIERDAVQLFELKTSELVQSLARLRRHLLVKAIAAGEAGAFVPFATAIRQEMIDERKELYRSDYGKGFYRQLLTWGYEPSNWRRRHCGPQRRSTRRSAKIQRKYYVGKIRFTYGDLKAHSEAKLSVFRLKIRKHSSHSHSVEREKMIPLRAAIQAKRKSSLGKLRRLLTSTLLAYEERTISSLFNPSTMSMPLEGMKIPSKSTLVGKTCVILGFGGAQTPYKQQHKWKKFSKITNERKRRHPIARPEIMGKTSNSVTLNEDRSGESTNNSIEPHYFRSGQTVQPFRPSPHLRLPHSTTFITDTKLWEGGNDGLTNTYGNDMETGQAGDDFDSSLNNRESVLNSNAEAPDNPPPSEPNLQPSTNMAKKSSDEDEPSESEHENGFESETNGDSEIEEAEEPHTPLTYQIPPDVLINSLQAPPQTRASYWNHKLYRGPENEELLLHYCPNMEISERVAQHFLNNKVLGFDIEWKVFAPLNSIKQNASLIQIANENRIALFHIARFQGKTPEQLMPPTLKIILESADTLKVGVAVKGDATRLMKYFDLEIRGVFELSRLYNLVKHYATDPDQVNNRLVKLATQVEQHLLLPLYKGEPLVDEPERRDSVRESDWSKPLDYEQMCYAADDAYAGFRLFDVLESKRKKMKPTPPIPRLCDYDNKPVPRTRTPAMLKAQKERRAKAQAKKAALEALSGSAMEDVQEEAYVTAAEELSEGDDDESVDHESSSCSSEESEDDTGGDYVPERHGQVDLGQLSGDPLSTSEPRSRRIGRVNFSKLTTGDPGYPTLPVLSSDDQNSSAESEAFDPPKVRVKRRTIRKTTQATVAIEVEASQTDDEFADPELEKALNEMDLDLKQAQTTIKSVAEEQLDHNMSDADAGHETTEIPSDTSDHTSTIYPTEPPPPSFQPPLIADDPSRTPEYNLATTWAQAYLISTIPSPSSTAPSRIRSTIPSLRAYHLWYHQGVPLAYIGTHLRDPPLTQNTVSSYIVQAICTEKLAYREDDIVALLRELPASLRLGRYAWLSRKVGILR